MTSKTKFLFVAIFTLALIFSGCAKGKTSAVEKPEQVFNVSTMIVEKGPISNYIKLGGDVTTETNVDVYPEVTYGKVVRINAVVGKTVRKGETLAVVDPSMPGVTYAANPVVAPISGYVTALYAQVGQVVNSAAPIVRIGVLDRPSDIYVKTFVPEKYVSQVKAGMPADIHFSYEEKPFKAVVKEITPVIDPFTRTFEIWLRFVKYTSAIKVGSYPDIKLYVEEKSSAVTVPVDAVLNRGDKQTVYVYDDSAAQPKAIAKEVETGIRIDGKYEILKGLSAGERLIFKGHALLIDGSLVTDHVYEAQKQEAAEAARAKAATDAAKAEAAKN